MYDLNYNDICNKDIGISLATTFATSKSSRGFFSRLFGR